MSGRASQRPVDEAEDERTELPVRITPARRLVSVEDEGRLREAYQNVHRGIDELLLRYAGSRDVEAVTRRTAEELTNDCDVLMQRVTEMRITEVPVLGSRYQDEVELVSRTIDDARRAISEGRLEDAERLVRLAYAQLDAIGDVFGAEVDFLRNGLPQNIQITGLTDEEAQQPLQELVLDSLEAIIPLAGTESEAVIPTVIHAINLWNSTSDVWGIDSDEASHTGGEVLGFVVARGRSARQHEAYTQQQAEQDEAWLRSLEGSVSRIRTETGERNIEVLTTWQTTLSRMIAEERVEYSRRRLEELRDEIEDALERMRAGQEAAPGELQALASRYFRLTGQEVPLSEEERTEVLTDAATELRGSTETVRDGTAEWFGEQALIALREGDRTVAALAIALGMLERSASGSQNGARDYLSPDSYWRMHDIIRDRLPATPGMLAEFSAQIEIARLLAEADRITRETQDTRPGTRGREPAAGSRMPGAGDRVLAAAAEVRERVRHGDIEGARRLLNMDRAYLELLERNRWGSWTGSEDVERALDMEIQGQDGSEQFRSGAARYQFGSGIARVRDEMQDWAPALEQRRVVDGALALVERLVSAGEIAEAQRVLTLIEMYADSIERLGSRRGGRIVSLTPEDRRTVSGMEGALGNEGIAVDERQAQAFMESFTASQQAYVGREAARLEQLARDRGRPLGREQVLEALNAARERAQDGDFSGAYVLLNFVAEFYGRPVAARPAVPARGRRPAVPATEAMPEGWRYNLLARTDDPRFARGRGQVLDGLALAIEDPTNAAAEQRFRTGASLLAQAAAERTVRPDAGDRVLDAGSRDLRASLHRSFTPQIIAGLDTGPNRVCPAGQPSAQELLNRADAAIESADATAFRAAVTELEHRVRQQNVRTMLGSLGSLDALLYSLPVYEETPDRRAPVGGGERDARRRTRDREPAAEGRVPVAGMPRAEAVEVMEEERAVHITPRRRQLIQRRDELRGRLIILERSGGEIPSELLREYARLAADIERETRLSQAYGVVDQQLQALQQYRAVLLSARGPNQPMRDEAVRLLDLAIAALQNTRLEIQTAASALPGPESVTAFARIERFYRQATGHVRDALVIYNAEMAFAQRVYEGPALAEGSEGDYGREVRARAEQIGEQYVDARMAFFHDLLRGSRASDDSRAAVAQLQRRAQGAQLVEQAIFGVPVYSDRATSSDLKQFFIWQRNICDRALAARVTQDGLRSAEQTVETMMARVQTVEFYANVATVGVGSALMFVPVVGPFMGGFIFTAEAIEAAAIERRVTGHISAGSWAMIGLAVLGTALGTAGAIASIEARAATATARLLSLERTLSYANLAIGGVFVGTMVPGAVTAWQRWYATDRRDPSRPVLLNEALFSSSMALFGAGMLGLGIRGLLGSRAREVSFVGPELQEAVQFELRRSQRDWIVPETPNARVGPGGRVLDAEGARPGTRDAGPAAGDRMQAAELPAELRTADGLFEFLRQYRTRDIVGRARLLATVPEGLRSRLQSRLDGLLGTAYVRRALETGRIDGNTRTVLDRALATFREEPELTPPTPGTPGPGTLGPRPGGGGPRGSELQWQFSSWVRSPESFRGFLRDLFIPDGASQAELNARDIARGRLEALRAENPQAATIIDGLLRNPVVREAVTTGVDTPLSARMLAEALSGRPARAAARGRPAQEARAGLRDMIPPEVTAAEERAQVPYYQELQMAAGGYDQPVVGPRLETGGSRPGAGGMRPAGALGAGDQVLVGPRAMAAEGGGGSGGVRPPGPGTPRAETPNAERGAGDRAGSRIRGLRTPGGRRGGRAPRIRTGGRGVADEATGEAADVRAPTPQPAPVRQGWYGAVRDVIDLIGGNIARRRQAAAARVASREQAEAPFLEATCRGIDELVRSTFPQEQREAAINAAEDANVANAIRTAPGRLEDLVLALWRRATDPHTPRSQQEQALAILDRICAYDGARMALEERARSGPQHDELRTALEGIERDTRQAARRRGTTTFERYREDLVRQGQGEEGWRSWEAHIRLIAEVLERPGSDRRSQVVRQITELDVTIPELERQLQAARGRVEEATRTARARVDELSARADELDAQVGQAQEEVDVLTPDVVQERARQRRTELERELREVEGQIRTEGDAGRDTSRLEARQTELQELILQADGEANASRTDLLQEQVRIATGRRGALQQQLTEAGGQLQQARADAEAAVEAARQPVEQRAERLMELQTQLREAQRGRSTEGGRIRIREIERLIARAQRELHEAQSALDRTTAEGEASVAALEARRAQLQRQVAQAGEDVVRAEEVLSASQRVDTEHTPDAENALRLLVEARGTRLRELQGQRDRAQRELRDADVGLRGVTERAERRGRIAQLERELEEARQQYEAAEISAADESLQPFEELRRVLRIELAPHERASGLPVLQDAGLTVNAIVEMRVIGDHAVRALEDIRPEGTNGAAASQTLTEIWRQIGTRLASAMDGHRPTNPDEVLLGILRSDEVAAAVEAQFGSAARDAFTTAVGDGRLADVTRRLGTGTQFDGQAIVEFIRTAQESGIVSDIAAIGVQDQRARSEAGEISGRLAAAADDFRGVGDVVSRWWVRTRLRRAVRWVIDPHPVGVPGTRYSGSYRLYWNYLLEAGLYRFRTPASVGSRAVGVLEIAAQIAIWSLETAIAVSLVYGLHRIYTSASSVEEAQRRSRAEFGITLSEENARWIMNGDGEEFFRVLPRLFPAPGERRPGSAETLRSVLDRRDILIDPYQLDTLITEGRQMAEMIAPVYGWVSGAEAEVPVYGQTAPNGRLNELIEIIRDPNSTQERREHARTELSRIFGRWGIYWDDVEIYMDEESISTLTLSDLFHLRLPNWRERGLVIQFRDVAAEVFLLDRGIQETDRADAAQFLAENTDVFVELWDMYQRGYLPGVYIDDAIVVLQAGIEELRRAGPSTLRTEMEEMLTEAHLYFPGGIRQASFLGVLDLRAQEDQRFRTVFEQQILPLCRDPTTHEIIPARFEALNDFIIGDTETLYGDPVALARLIVEHPNGTEALTLARQQGYLGPAIIAEVDPRIRTLPPAEQLRLVRFVQDHSAANAAEGGLLAWITAQSSHFINLTAILTDLSTPPRSDAIRGMNPADVQRYAEQQIRTYTERGWWSERPLPAARPAVPPVPGADAARAVHVRDIRIQRAGREGGMEVVRPPPGSPAPAEQAEVPASDAAAQRQQRIDAFFQSAPQDLMNVIDAIVESEQATQEEARAAAYDFLTNIDVTPSGEPTPDIQIRRRSGIAVARVLTAEDFQAIDGFDDTHATPEFVARINQLLIDRESSDRTGTRAGTDLASALRGTGIDTRALDGYIRAHPELRLRIGDLSGENAQDTLMRNIIGRVSSARTSDGEAPEAAR